MNVVGLISGEGAQRCRTRWTRLALGRTPHRPAVPSRSGSMIETPAAENSFSASRPNKHRGRVELMAAIGAFDSVRVAREG